MVRDLLTNVRYCTELNMETGIIRNCLQKGQGRMLSISSCQQSIISKLTA
jgi:hypothetical protein